MDGKVSTDQSTESGPAPNDLQAENVAGKPTVESNGGSQPLAENLSESEPDPAPPVEKQDEKESGKSSGSSQLSVFAKEFVPQFLPAAAAPVTAPYTEPNHIIPPVNDYSASEVQDPFLVYFNGVLNEISFSPGHFEPMCRQLLSSLNQLPNLDEDILRMMVETIISLAVWEANFRYNGARLCNFLSRNLQTADSIPTFRYILLNRCKEIHEDRHNLIQSDAEFLRGFALFMSELFINMTLGDLAAAQRVAVIAKAARDLLQTLLDHPTPANVKCLCQILKLSGSVMEDDDRQANGGTSVEMEQLMNNIKTKAVTHEMPMHLKEMLLNLIEVRAKDWGRAPTSPPPPSSTVGRSSYAPPAAATYGNHGRHGQHGHHGNHAGSHRNNGKGAYYGPDGQMLTAEERAFLAQGGVHLDDDDDDYDDQDDDFGGMDDEMAQAFEEFLRMKDNPRPK